MRRAIAIFAGIFHIHGDAREIFHHDFTCEPYVTTGTAGSDDDFLEGEEGFFDGLKRIREDDVVGYILANGFEDGLGLLVNFAQHLIRKLSKRHIGWPALLAGHQCPAPVDDAGMPRPSFRGMVADAMFHPETVNSEPPKTDEDGR